jgi:hypothetical protein
MDRQNLSVYVMQEQTEQICLEAVRRNGNALQFVKNQTEQICLEAVEREGKTLQYVKNQTIKFAWKQ